ncbi:hypothetical protein [Tsukamurella serpentis]
MIPALLCIGMVIAALGVAMVTSAPKSVVPLSAQESMKTEAVTAVNALAGVIDRTVKAVRANPSVAQGDTSSLPIGSGLSGVEVINRAGATVASAGDAVRVSGAELWESGTAPRVARLGDALIVAVPAGPDRMVLAQVRVREVERHDDRRTVTVVRLDGAPLSGPPGYGTVAGSLVRNATLASAAGQQGFSASSQGVNDEEGEDSRHTSAAAAARLPGLGAGADVAVAVTGRVPAIEGRADRPGTQAAIVIGIASVLVFLLLYLMVVRPVRNLRDDIEALCSDLDAGRVSRVRLQRSAHAQVDRIAALVSRMPRVFGGSRDLTPMSDRRRAIPGGAVIAVAAVIAITALIVGGALVASRDSASGGADVVSAEQRAHETQMRLSKTLLSALTEVERATTPSVGTVTDWQKDVTAVLDRQPGLRSVYAVAGADGAVLAEAGTAPSAVDELRNGSGLVQVNSQGSEPIVAAVARSHDQKVTVIAEFAPRKLNDILSRSAAETVVLDRTGRVVLGSTGYLAFSEPAADIATVGGTASTVPSAEVFGSGDEAMILSAEKVGERAPATDLNWVLVQRGKVASAAFEQSPVQRAGAAVIGLATIAAGALMLWLYASTVMPLRRVIRWLEPVALDAPPPHPPAPAPARFDEVGALTAGLLHLVKRG